MGLMNLLRKFSENKNIKKEKMKEAEDELRIRQTIEERQKSVNRRELERYLKENEEEQIKKMLEKERAKRQRELWSGKSSIINDKKNIMKDQNQILKQKNIFKNETNIFTKKHLIKSGCDMGFFKWVKHIILKK